MFEKLEKSLFSFWNWQKQTLEEKVKEKVAEDCGIPKEKLPKVEYTQLPFIGKLTKYGISIIGKISGAYDKIRHRILIDPVDYCSRGIYGRIKLLAEEFYHAADNIQGKIKNRYKSLGDYLKNYHKDENEVRAKNKAERLARDIAGQRSSISLYGL